MNIGYIPAILCEERSDTKVSTVEFPITIARRMEARAGADNNGKEGSEEVPPTRNHANQGDETHYEKNNDLGDWRSFKKEIVGICDLNKQLLMQSKIAINSES